MKFFNINFPLKLAAAALLALALSAQAQTAKSRADLYTDANTLFSDLGDEPITPADLRTFLKNLTASSYNSLTDGAPGVGEGTVTSVATTVPTGLTISGSPVTASGTLAIGLDTGRVIPTQAALDAKAATATTITASTGLTGGGDLSANRTLALSSGSIASLALADSALQPNTPVTGATKTKITYDADGLVTAGADATTADIADSTNARYVTDAQLTVIGNTSGTNTGDQTTITGNAGTATTLATARNINGVSFNGSANITVPSDIAAGTSGNVMTSNGTVWTSATPSSGGTLTSMMATMRKRVAYWDDFFRADQTHSGEWFSTGIASGTITGVVVSDFSNNHPGVVIIKSAGGANSGHYIGFRMTGATTSPQLIFGGGETFEFIFKLGALANGYHRFGFQNSNSASDAVDGAYVEIDGSGVLTGKTANNSARTSTGTTYTLSTDTWYRAKILLNSDATRADFYVYNDSGTELWTSYNTTNIPTTRMTGCAVLSVDTVGNTRNLTYCDWMAFWIDRDLAR